MVVRTGGGSRFQSQVLMQAKEINRTIVALTRGTKRSRRSEY